jgi:hypothetical protein
VPLGPSFEVYDNSNAKFRFGTGGVSIPVIYVPLSTYIHKYVLGNLPMKYLQLFGTTENISPADPQFCQLAIGLVCATKCLFGMQMYGYRHNYFRGLIAR